MASNVQGNISVCLNGSVICSALKADDQTLRRCASTHASGGKALLLPRISGKVPVKWLEEAGPVVKCVLSLKR